MLTDKRRHTRAPLSGKVIMIAGENIKLGMSKDISSSGIFIETVELPAIGDIMNILFSLPGSKKTAQTNAKVVRIVEPVSDDDNIIPGMGLEFMDNSLEASTIIDNYVVMAKYAYEELLLLTTMKNPDIERIVQILEKLRVKDYKDLFELRDRVQKVCYGLGLLKKDGE